MSQAINEPKNIGSIQIPKAKFGMMLNQVCLAVGRFSLTQWESNHHPDFISGSIEVLFGGVKRKPPSPNNYRDWEVYY